MHVNAVAKTAAAYEHIDPAAVGNSQNILVSELSGRSNILLKASELGLTLGKTTPPSCACSSGSRGSRQRDSSSRRPTPRWNSSSARNSARTAPLRAEGISLQLPPRRLGILHQLHRHGHRRRRRPGDRDHRRGDGPVNASTRPSVPLWANFILGFPGSPFPTTRSVSSTGEGEPPHAPASTSSPRKGKTPGTVGVSDNIIEASWMALVDSLEFRAAKRSL